MSTIKEVFEAGKGIPEGRRKGGGDQRAWHQRRHHLYPEAGGCDGRRRDCLHGQRRADLLCDARIRRNGFRRIRQEDSGHLYGQL